MSQPGFVHGEQLGFTAGHIPSSSCTFHGPCLSQYRQWHLLTDLMFSTGGSMNWEPRLETMNAVTQKATRSGRRDRTISIRCIWLHEFSHSPARSDSEG